MIKTLIKKIFKKILNDRGLEVYPKNEYLEKIELVKYNWLKNIKIDTIIDVGASNGGFAKKIREWFPAASIHSFEPLTHSFNELKEKFQGDSNFTAYNIVLSDQKGSVTFYQNDYSGSSSLLEMEELHKDAYPQTSNETKIEVEADTLDAVFSEGDQFKSNKVLLKIDVQGAEKKVIDGGKEFLKNVDVIFTEVSFISLYKDSITFNKLAALLEEHGFVVFGFENISQHLENGIFLQADTFFVKEKLLEEISNSYTK